MLLMKRPWWDRVAFAVAPVCVWFGTESVLNHYTSLGWGSRNAIGLVLACMLAVGLSLVLDKVRRRFGQ